MLTISPINLTNKNIYSYNTRVKKSQGKETIMQTTTILPPPPEFYRLSFGQTYSNKEYTLQGQVKKLAPEQYPSLKILELANKILEEDPNTKKTIYDVHNEYYALLLAAKTLDEAKALYPEFQDVIDASTLIIDHNSPLALKKISRGEIEGVTIKNATLVFLKQYYGKMGSPKKKEDFFGFGPIACHTVFDSLNIKRPNRNYVMFYSLSKPEHRNKMSDMRRRVAATPKYKENASKAQRKRWDKNDGAERKRAAETQKRVWASLSEEEKQAWRENQLRVQRTPEYREQAKKRIEEFWRDPQFREAVISGYRNFLDTTPEYREIKSQAWKAHPDILQIMSDTLNDFPQVRPIIAKRHDGIPLTASENNAQKQYLAECKRRCPDMYRRVNQTFSKMWQEYKESKEKDEN